MTESDIKQEIVRELDRLPVEWQRRVLDFAQALALSRPKGVPGKQLLRFAGILTAAEAEILLQDIETGCERVDVNEW